MKGVISGAGAYRKRVIRAMDLAVLLYHVYMASKDPEIGFEGVDETLDTLTGKLNQEFQVDLPLLESALWSCNLLNEKEKFWHPRGLTFKQFVKDLFPGERFNLIYNVIEEKNGR
jgi:hypothetical protein